MRRFGTIIFVFVCSIFLLGCASTKSGGGSRMAWTNDPPIAPDVLRQDIAFLTGKLQTVHPGFNDGSSRRKDFQEAAEALEGNLTEPLTQGQFFMQLTPLVSAMNDGHTWVWLPLRRLEAIESTGEPLFPFDILFMGQAVHILRGYTKEAAIPPGVEIVEINGVPVSEIVRQFSTLISSENLPRRLHEMEGESDLFKIFLQIVYGSNPRYTIAYLENGVRREATISSVTVEQLNAQRDESAEAIEPFSCAPISPNAALMRIDTFEIEPPKYRRLFRSAFHRLRQEKIEHLIIDVRGNDGGILSMAVELLRYFMPEPFALSALEINASADVKKNIKQSGPALTRWLPVQYLNEIGRRLWEAPEGTIVTVPSQIIRPQPARRRFYGTVYVLADEGSYSTAAVFASLMKSTGLGEVIGRETGGAADKTFGHPITFTMPGSGLHFSSASMRIRMNTEIDAPPGRGVIPDHEVNRNLDDIVAGRDTAMEFVKDLIERRAQASDGAQAASVPASALGQSRGR